MSDAELPPALPIDRCSGDAALDSNKWVYGVIAWVAACFFAAAGVLLQKYAHTREESKPIAADRSPFYKQPIWWLGFFMLVVFPLPMNMSAMALAPQSLLAPLQSTSLVFNGAARAPRLLCRTR